MKLSLVTFPNTGCCDSVDSSNQSRNLLCTVLMKNCDPPLLGLPVFAMENVLHDTISYHRIGYKRKED